MSIDPGRQVPEDLVKVGRITTVYGVKGWVKVHSYTEPMDNLFDYPALFIQRAGRWQPLELEEFRRHQKGLIARIKGVEDREMARSFCQCDIAVPAGDMPVLEDDEFYWHELEGLKVYTTGTQGESRLLGKVDHLLETGANDVMVVKRCQGSIDGRERLIPWLPDQVVKAVDMAAGSIQVEWDADF